jgi:FAD/FMN-containing dehydrogenase
MPNGAIGDGVIVDLSRWRHLGAVDVEARSIRVGPGITRGEVDAAARAHGLRFPVDPSSGAFCTIGGMTATNAAGSHSMHFGSMRKWVRAIDCVFADGTRRESRSKAGHPDRSEGSAVLKNSSGYFIGGDLVELLVGSEGTLAFFVEIELALTPVAAATSSILGAFSSLEHAVVAATNARNAGAVACELLDKTFLDVAASGGAERRVPAETESALLAEVEGADPESAADAAREVEKIFRDAGATTISIALDTHTETELWELRHAASPILARLDANLRSMQFIEDCAVPPENLPKFVRELRAIFGQNDVRGVIFGHAGDAHVHANALIDFRWADWRQRVDRILDQTVELTASLGGTLSGEHGDGRLRAPLLPRVWSSTAIERFLAVKREFDPENILNPGVKVALPGQQPVNAIKYDPSLPPLPPRARSALQRVESERAYARFRLAMLDD